jgi:hypothetical protein
MQIMPEDIPYLFKTPLAIPQTKNTTTLFMKKLLINIKHPLFL